MLVFAFISFIVLYGIWIWQGYAEFKRESAAGKEQHIANERENLKIGVQSVVHYVRYMKNQTEKRLEEQIQGRVNEAWAIAGNIYEENKGKKPDSEIKKMIKDALRPIRFNHGRGYYFIFNMDGVEELFADRPELEGQSVMEMQGSKGEYVVRDMLEIIAAKGEGFYSYTWSKPGDKALQHQKTAFVKKFEPYGWVMGTGEYVKDVTDEIQKEVLERISTLRFDKEGYFFGSIYGGDPLFTNGQITKGTKNLWDLTDPKGIKIIQEQNKIVKVKDGGFVSYSWQKLNSETLSPKLSYVMDIPEWEWIIGAGVYLDTVDEIIRQKESELYREFLKQAGIYLLAMVLISFLIYLWTRRQTRTIQSGIKLFSEFFESASLHDTTIDPAGLQFEEFMDIAGSANQMIEKRAEAIHALERSEKKYEAITNSLQDAIFCKGEDRRYTFVNPAMAHFLHLKRENLIGKTPEELFDPKTAAVITEVDSRTFNGERVNEIRTLEVNGAEYSVHTIQVPLEIVDDRVISICGVARDITSQLNIEKQRKQAEYRAQEQEKHALVGRIAGKMSHDFNNILGVIMGHSELALMDCTDEGLKNTLELILSQTLRGRNLTKNLIAFARDQEPRQEYFNLNEKIDLVIHLMKKEMEGIMLAREFENDIPEILADPGMMEHTLVNLLQNSIHALGKQKEPKIIIRTFARDQRVCFEVEDNGCGIPKEHINVIFDPSFTLKGGRDITGSYGSAVKGTGYGLSNVKRYMDQHQGNVSVRSEFGTGTCLTLCLPVIKKNLTAEEKEHLYQSGLQTGKRILIVEDEPAIFEVQRRILTTDPCCHKVEIAQNGRSALDLLKNQQYDLVSLDFMLPGDISGMEIYRQIRKRDLELPVLFISGNIEFIESIRELKKNDPFMDHRSKPCRNQEYIEGINGLLEKS